MGSYFGGKDKGLLANLKLRLTGAFLDGKGSLWGGLGLLGIIIGYLLLIIAWQLLFLGWFMCFGEIVHGNY